MRSRPLRGLLGRCESARECAGRYSFSDVTVAFAGREALSNLNLAIRAGETVAIVGPHGQRQNNAGQFDSAAI